jgi:putative DNA primase/helicase
MNAPEEIIWDGLDADDRSETPGDHLTKQSRAAWYFAQMAGDRVRFDHGRHRWLVWRGHRWQPDKDGEVERIWLQVLAERYRQALAADDHERQRLTAEVQAAGATNAAVVAGLELASIMEPIATRADAWDPDPYLLGCENGVIDLGTGELRPGRPEDMVSRSTGINYNPDAQCPRWLQFLMEVFAGDRELVEWFELSIGSTLVGRSNEILSIWYGKGNNGKSVARKTVTLVFGDYVVDLAIETLTNSKRQAGGATPDLMPLRGARLAFASEPDKAARLRGGTLKRLSNIDRMTARPLYGEQESWPQTHDMVLATNHPPETDDVTDSFWRRIALVPFPIHFAKPGEEGPPEDGGLADTLATEAPGILAWAVRGAVAFVADPQCVKRFPVAVAVETAALRAEQDPLSGFVESRVVFERTATVSLGELYAAYEDWCAAEDVPEQERLRTRAFKTAFEDRDQRVKFQRGTGRGHANFTHGCTIRTTQSPIYKVPYEGAILETHINRPPNGANGASDEDDYPSSAWDVAP